jgi:transposase
MTSSNRSDRQAGARKRAEVIMKVRCGLMTASQAAQQLGVSRKTYYRWERRGLAGLLDGVSTKEAGRPEKTASAESPLEKQLADTLRENELLKQKLILKDLVSGIGVQPGMGRAKKK